MIIITFPDHTTKCRALGFLSGRFAFKSWATGEMMVPEDALAQLTLEGIQFVVRDKPQTGSLVIAALEPRDQWERGLLEAARPWGVSFSDAALSSDGLYD
ncbi:MAG: hypothetical protein HYR84_11245 [Planctomycetes bacterium]|nr:hypothetical protein [Planctomycetota bacterium]